MPRLDWISERNLRGCISKLMERCERAYSKADKNVVKNVQDPFWLLCMTKTFGISNPDDLRKLQESASALSGASSAVGDFHQNVLGRVNGFRNHDAGYDVENKERKILAEIKNKHNTMNAGNRNDVEKELISAVKSRPGYTAYLVIMIPKTPIRYRREIGRRVFEVDGSSFYTIATGQQNALKDLYETLATDICAEESMRKHCLAIFEKGMAS